MRVEWSYVRRRGCLLEGVNSRTMGMWLTGLRDYRSLGPENDLRIHGRSQTSFEVPSSNRTAAALLRSRDT